MGNAGYTLIEQSLELAGELFRLADQSDMDDSDDGCAVLLGIVRDCAYKIRGRAEQEREVHRLRGQWNGAAVAGADE